MDDQRTGPGEDFDHELDLRRILVIGAWVAGVSIAAFVLMAVLNRGLASRERALDPPPSPIAEANTPPPRPDPRLQETPEKDLAALRREEDEMLTSYGWVDRNAGVARIPIERAIELTLARGLPARPAPPPGAPAAAGARP